MSARRRACVPILTLCALALVAMLPGFVRAGGIDPLVPNQVAEALKKYGLITKAGVSAVQPLDTQLTDLAGLSYGSNGLKVVRVNAGATGFELATAGGAGNLSDGDATTPALNFASDTNTGLFRPGADALAVSLGGTQGVTFNSTYTYLGDLTSYGGRRGFHAAITAGVGGPTALNSDPDVLVHNTGTTVKAACTLPSAGTNAGRHIYFVVTDADGLRINAASGDAIQLPHGVSATSGYVESVRQWSTLYLTALDETTWAATVEPSGTWRFDSTTSAGYAYTPTPEASFTPGGQWTTNATYTGTFRHIGDRVYARVKVAAAGAVTGTGLYIDAISGYAFDTAKAPSDGSGYVECPGIGHLYDTSNLGSLRTLYFTSESRFYVFYHSSATALAALTPSAPNTLGSADAVHLVWDYPVQRRLDVEQFDAWRVLKRWPKHVRPLAARRAA